MLLKPRNTVFNERAKVYKRFLSIDEVRNKRVIYRTPDNKFWMFNSVSLDFDETTAPTEPNIKKIYISDETLEYRDKYYSYGVSGWEVRNSGNYKLLSMEFGNTARFQANKYYFVGTMDYIIKGAIEGNATQWIKGNALPLNSFNIQYFDDELILCKDDLVVIGTRLFEVEDTEVVQKRQPKPYYVYSSTLNNIL